MFAQVTIYVRITDAKGRRHYERLNRRTPQPGIYCLRFEVEGKRRWETIGPDLNTAAQARMRRESELLLGARAVLAPKPLPQQTDSLEGLRASFLSDKKTSRKKNGELRTEATIRSYDQLTREFLDFVEVTSPDQITKESLRAWIAALYARKRHSSEETIAHRTVVNLYIGTVCFLHYLGIDHKRLVPEADRPAAVEEEPEAYSDSEMTRFFAAVTNERDRLAFTFLRRTGAREQEMTNLEWSNLNLGEKPTVTFRNQGGFRTKTRKFRTVPLDPEFAAVLRGWQREHGTEKYVFGREDGSAIEGHYLRKCKEIAEAAGMDAGDFWLHKFRDTACSNWLLRGVPLRTCQKWMGHASITMTERYLAPEQDDVQQSLMARVWAPPTSAVSASA